MESRWSDQEAQRYLNRYAAEWGDSLALRVYTSHLIGSDSDLVLHGGGNTSLKGVTTTLLGDRFETLWVKGSGSDLDRIQPAGFPALDLAYLRRLRLLDSLSDEEMVNQLRTHLADAIAPNPSVETLLHAFLPHTWIDHTHADAIVALTNQVEGESLIRKALGPSAGIVPYAMPGLRLARLAATVFEADPSVEALVLMNHGLFTFGQDARESYERTIRYVDLAEQFLKSQRAGRIDSIGDGAASSARRRWARLAPICRGLLAQPSGHVDRPWRRMVLDFRSSPEILSLLADQSCARLAAEGPLTPDHTIRTKSHPLFLDNPPIDDPEQFRSQLSTALEGYRGAYEAYFARQAERSGRRLTRLQPDPAALLLPGLGIVGVGPTSPDASAAADIGEHTVRIKALADSVGRYKGLPEEDLFDVEYWSLEQAKLGRRSESALAGQVALITGGAGAIGVGVAARLLAEGAHVVLGDRDDAGLERARARLGDSAGGRLQTLAVDVTDEGSVQACLEAVCVRYGGLDLLVANAGIAHSASLVDTELDAFRRVQDVNLVGYFLAIREAARVMKLQGTGGNVVISASKNVFAPGSEFGAYSASKAAGHQLGKVAALELAKDGIRVNMINADAIFGDEEIPSGIWREVGPRRARARGLEPDQLPDFYRGRNLLKAEIRPEHLGNAVVFFASNATPTTGATLPVDGGLPEAFPR